MNHILFMVPYVQQMAFELCTHENQTHTELESGGHARRLEVSETIA